MGRKRSFDTAEVITRAGEVFAVSGYHGSSVDELLAATGIQRASLYQAFGSKRQLFVDVLRATENVDVLLVALMDLAADDDEVRTLVAQRLRAAGGDPIALLGRSLLDRAHLSPFVHLEEPT